MKKLTLFTSAFLLGILAHQVPAQDYVWYSSSNFYEPQIIFSNPAGISFRGGRQAILSSQLLYTGLANDNLYNHYWGYAEPIRGIGVVGFRGNFFNSLMFRQNTFSLLYSRSLAESRLSFGVNLNLHHYSYDRDNFRLLDPDDPLLAKGTSTTVFGAGLGAIYNPLPDLYLGMSLDNINRPDVSLQSSRANKPLAASFGLSYRIFNLVPELDVKYLHNSQRSETYYVFGLRQLWLGNSANLSVQYQQHGISIGGAYSFGNLLLDYNYTYPLNELQEISAGSHQFTLSYDFGRYRGYPSAPKISLLTERTEVDTDSIRIQAQVEDKRGLRQIMIQFNDETTTYNYTKQERAAAIDAPVFPLREGENKIRIIASNDTRTSSKDIRVTYKPSDKISLKTSKTSPVIVSLPKIEILTSLGKETKTSSLRLTISVEFVVDLKDIKVKINNKEIQFRGVRTLSKEKDKMDVEVELDLEEGMNEVEVIAHNDHGSSSEKKDICYNPITESLYNQLWAVVIGIDDYKDRDVEDLNYAVRDARGVEKLLKDRFRFDHVITLYNSNATRDNIIRAFSTELKEAKEEDGIFIFFAGHGCTGEGITGGPLGYIVPVDGTLDENEFYVKNIPMSVIKEISQTISAKHIYYVMDCCYGGLLLRAGEKKEEPAVDANYPFLKTLAKWRVRQVLTAGGKGQPVLDGGLGGHSVFTGRLVQGLRGEADINRDGFITAEELNFFVRQRVHADVKDIARVYKGDPLFENVEQMPQYGKWFGQGEFIFTVTIRQAGNRTLR